MTKEGFWADSINVSVITVNRQLVNIYKRYTIEVAVTDISDIIRTSNVLFIVTDLKRYKAILDYL